MFAGENEFDGGEFVDVDEIAEEEGLFDEIGGESTRMGFAVDVDSFFGCVFDFLSVCCRLCLDVVLGARLIFLF